MSVDLGPLPARTPFAPLHIGPTWETDDDGEFVLPEYTLGWSCIAWAADNLIGADGEGSWSFTWEQVRFILWYYAIDKRGRWLYRDAILQRIKGWGKDPIAAVICAFELVGPCRFSHWEHDDFLDADGRPQRLAIAIEGARLVARDQPRAWVQIVGTAREQTKNTMTFLQGLFKKAAMAKYGIQVFKEIIWAQDNTRRIEVITSSPRTMEGNRPSFVVKNETHHWISSNEGPEVDRAIRRNVNKMRKQLGARTLAVTNAYNPAENSVAQTQREAYEKETARGRGRVLYDSLEAPEKVPLFPDYTSLDDDGNIVVERDEFGQRVPPSEEVIRHHLTEILGELCGDAVWLDSDETIDEILDPQSIPSDMRRYYLNSVVSGDDDYLADGDIKATVHPAMVEARAPGERGDVLRLGWTLVGADEPITMFFDGSKSDDSTALVGCRISDGYVFLIGIWERPPEDRGGSGWLAPRREISGRVHEAFARFNVVAFWADPSHTKDDEHGTRYWDAVIDEWHVAYHEQLQYWAVQSGDRRSSVMWDMTDPAKQKLFSDEVVRFADEMDLQTVVWDGHPVLWTHMRNARRSWGGIGGLSIRKPARGGRRKIDAAVCAIGAKMLARLVMLKGLDKEESKAGNGWY